MSQDAEKVKCLLNFRQKIEKRIDTLKSELKEVENILKIIDSIIVEKGFKSAAAWKSPPSVKAPETTGPLSPPKEHEDIISLKAVNGTLLAQLFLNKDFLQVTPVADIQFSVNSPPFSNFLVDRVLTKMYEKDNMLVKKGQLEPGTNFSFSIEATNNVLREIRIKNVSKSRLRELISSIRWTLEKLYEKSSGEKQ
jgi:hypothetical protein